MKTNDYNKSGKFSQPPEEEIWEKERLQPGRGSSFVIWYLKNGSSNVTLAHAELQQSRSVPHNRASPDHASG